MGAYASVKGSPNRRVGLVPTARVAYQPDTINDVMARHAERRTSVSRRLAFGVGFVIGAVALVPVAIASFLSSWPQWLRTLLAPGAAMVEFLGVDAWPGMAPMILAAFLNGVAYGLVALILVVRFNAQD